MTVRIYALIDPRDGGIRYIGKTVGLLERRLYQHMWCAKRGDRTHRGRWLSSLDTQGLKPVIREIEVVADGDSWPDRERHWISHFRRQLGDRLTNISDGGDGCHGVPRTDEWKQKIADAQRGKARGKLSEEHRRNISLGNIGRVRPKSHEHRQKISAAMMGKKRAPCSNEQKRLLSQKFKGRPGPVLTAEQQEKLLANVRRGDSHPQAKLTIEKVSLIRGDKRSSSAVAADFGVSKSTIKAIRQNKIWRE